ncbi:MAG: phosphoketolase family protein [Bdellovibrionales bacterium]|nr:phosphoketolase family protein [Bdellovibrionales bacterium]
MQHSSSTEELEQEFSHRASIDAEPLSPDDLVLLDGYWRAANFLSVGQIYLRDNVLLREPLRLEHVKPRLLGHWGTTPGLTFVYVHLNRVIKRDDLNMIYVIGPGHGGPALYAHTYLEGSYSELYPDIPENAGGLHALCRQFSWPGGVPSHVAAEVPGSINEGGELGYSLLHAYGAVLDNPDLIACCIVGDGEAETGACAASWHSNKFLNPNRDGVVLPILHLNGYKIAGPSFFARLSEEELVNLFRGYGYEPYFVEGYEHEFMHQRMAATLDHVLGEIRTLRAAQQNASTAARPRWPMIILRSPKGWTGPREVDGKLVEGTFRSHQVPLSGLRETPEHLAQLERWLRSYRPQDLFDDDGRLLAKYRALAPEGDRRMGKNPHANGGLILKPLALPDYREFAVSVDRPGQTIHEATRAFGHYLRKVFELNADAANFRIMCPDETNSNRLNEVFKATERVLVAEHLSTDEQVSANGRVMEVLSEHLCQGWLEGYLLSGRHGIFPCYEAFIHIVSSMFNQHAKWLKVTREIPWRAPIASLNYLLSSHVWRQDHNGFSHQDPGFIDHVVNKKPEVVRVYLPPDANTLLVVGDLCLRSKNYVNVIVAGKQPALQWFSIADAERHCAAGIGRLDWASNDDGADPDVVMACAGDVPTLETLAATALLRKLMPMLTVRVVNIVDLMTLQPRREHPHGLSDDDFDALFTTDRPIIFAYHGYPWLIHRLSYRRRNHENMHVRGYKEEGTTTTPFDMVFRNDMDRYKLALDAIERVARVKAVADEACEFLMEARRRHVRYVAAHGEDMPEVEEWQWPEELSS